LIEYFLVSLLLLKSFHNAIHIRHCHAHSTGYSTQVQLQIR